MSSSVYISIPVMLLLTILQTAVLPYFQISNLSPQLPLLVALSWGLLRGLNEGALWAFVGGLLMDLFSITPLGTTAISYMVAVTAVLWVKEAFPTSRVFLPVALSALATIIFLIVNLILLRLFNTISSLQVVTTLWPLILINAIVMLPVYWITYGIVRTIWPRRVQL